MNFSKVAITVFERLPQMARPLRYALCGLLPKHDTSQKIYFL